MYDEKLYFFYRLCFQELKYDYLPPGDRVKARNGHN